MKTPEQRLAENEQFPAPFKQIFNFLDRVLPEPKGRVIINPQPLVRVKRVLTADGLIPKSRLPQRP